LALLVPEATADVPQLINCQGRLTDSTGAAVPDGDYSVTFRIYDDSIAGVTLWQEGQLVTVQDGLFSIILGGVWPVPDSVFSDTGRWLGVQVGLDPELSPRSKLVSVGYAFKAGFADSASHALDKTTNADELVAGTLDTQRYSAYDDLISEDKVGDGSGQIAAGDHSHVINGVSILIDTFYVSTDISEGEGEVVIKTMTIPAGMVGDFMRISAVAGKGPGGGGVEPKIIVRVDGAGVWDVRDPSTNMPDINLLKQSNGTWCVGGGKYGVDAYCNISIDTTAPFDITISAQVFQSGSTYTFWCGTVVVEFGSQ